MVKFCLRNESYVSTPSIHNDFSSSIKGVKKRSICFPGYSPSGQITVRKTFCSFNAIPGGKLYGTTNTDQQEYVLRMLWNGEKPTVDSPKRTFRGSATILDILNQNSSMIRHQKDVLC